MKRKSRAPSMILFAIIGIVFYGWILSRSPAAPVMVSAVEQQQSDYEQRVEALEAAQGELLKRVARLEKAIGVTQAVDVVPTTASTTVVASRNIGTVNRSANVRSGPGTGYTVARGVTKGTQVTIGGYTDCGSERWYYIGPREWIAAFLVDNNSSNGPLLDVECTVSSPPTATPRPTNTPTPLTVTDTGCPGGCTSYPDWCAPPIKGNVSYNSGEKIYHVPGQENYDDTVINPTYGERWFCTEAEATAAGWRKAYR